jgi:hypothetical protein
MADSRSDLNTYDPKSLLNSQPVIITVIDPVPTKPSFKTAHH